MKIMFNLKPPSGSDGGGAFSNRFEKIFTKWDLKLHMY